MGEKGWTAPTWPTQYGGGGLTPAQGRIVQQEMARAGAYHPAAFGMGITMIGPTIMDYGTEEQKAKHLPPIIRGDVQWCVGYSEPNAGSDLASLMTKCEDKGDHWLINGQKIWTSGAQYSDWCGCLVRTDFAAKKHDGISFMLLSMRQPGVETRPIKLISGASPFCETFFADARCEKDEMLGPINVAGPSASACCSTSAPARPARRAGRAAWGRAAPACRTWPRAMSAWTKRAASPMPTCGCA
ncbi:MAG: acyl-CoA dehydrogenase family protein, partial [Caulobacteraceae bacterium]